MGINSSLQERKDLLFGMYQENCTHARHFEALRISVTSIVIAGAVGIISVAAAGGLHCDDWPITVGLMIIGFYGAVFTSTYFKRITGYDQLAAEFCGELDVLVFEPDEEVTRTKLRRLKEIQDTAAEKHKDTFARWSELPKAVLFRMFWPLTIALIGAAATVYLLFSWLRGSC
jgi:hypothetical protein